MKRTFNNKIKRLTKYENRIPKQNKIKMRCKIINAEIMFFFIILIVVVNSMEKNKLH